MVDWRSSRSRRQKRESPHNRSHPTWKQGLSQNVAEQLLQNNQQVTPTTPTIHSLSQKTQIFFCFYNRYESTVTAQFFGHTHSEKYELIYDEVKGQRAVAVSYVAPSVTTYTYLNPAYRIYYVEGQNPSNSSVSSRVGRLSVRWQIKKLAILSNKSANVTNVVCDRLWDVVLRLGKGKSRGKNRMEKIVLGQGGLQHDQPIPGRLETILWENDEIGRTTRALQ